MFVTWLAKYKWKKIIENYNSVDAEAHKEAKVVSYPNFPDIWNCEIGELHIFKKFGLSSFKKIL